MSKQARSSKNKDLKERTFEFSTKSIGLVRLLPNNSVNYHLTNQYLRASTSIGANYREADGADSKKEFKHKMGISKKEAKESYYWLGLIKHANKNIKDSKLQDLIDWLVNEAKELLLIFSKIVSNLK